MLETLGRAAGVFAVTNIDDLLLLALYFARATGAGRRAELKVVAGQFLGIGAIVAIAVAGALGAGLLPGEALRWLGVLPLLLGLRAGWSVLSDHRRRTAVQDDDEHRPTGPPPVSVAGIALVTLANGGDNIGVYVPVFATSGTGALIGYALVFAVLTLVWCLAGRFLATRATVAQLLSRWGHLVLPVVLIGIGVLILLG